MGKEPLARASTASIANFCLLLLLREAKVGPKDQRKGKAEF